jgi:hypothetical protein
MDDERPLAAETMPATLADKPQRTSRRRWMRRTAAGAGVAGLWWTGLGVGLMRATGLSRWVGGRVPFTISPETTGIVAPLDAWGFPDYVAEYNARMSAGVLPEENFEAGLHAVFGSTDVPEELVERYLRPRNGSSVAIGPTFRKVAEVFPELAESDRIRIESEDLVRAVEGPWSDVELPRVATWLDANRVALEQVVEASSREKSFLPCGPLDPWKSVDESPLTGLFARNHIGETRLAARLLRARALRELSTGTVSARVDDLIAVARMGRHSTRDGMLISLLVGIAMEAIALEGIAVLLDRAEWTVADLQRLAERLEQLPAMPTTADVMTTGERLFVLDFLVHMARHNRSEESEFEMLLGGDHKITRAAIDAALWCGVDWDIVLREADQLFERIGEMLAKKTRDEQRTVSERLVSELRQTAGMSQSRFLEWFRPLLQTRTRTSQRAAAIILGAALPAYTSTGEADRRAFVRRQMTWLAVALKRYRLERGSYPDGWESLPETRERREGIAVALEPGKLVYRREGEGFVLSTETPSPENADPEESPPFELVIRVGR